jgi:hypothetical protein
MLDSDCVVANDVHTALETLQARSIPVQGPFSTPNHSRIYLVDGCILTETELVDLHEAGKFAPERVRGVLRHLRSTQLPRHYYLEAATGPVFQDRRRSERVMLRLNLLVRLETAQGRPLQTHAFTVVVNANGGQLRSPFRMVLDQNLTLINPETGKEVNCRVVAVDRTTEDYLVSFAFGQPDSSFWPLTHPRPIEAKT